LENLEALHNQFILAINQAIGLVWQHPRPFMAGIGHAWISHATDSSFPSDHTTVSFGVALAAWARIGGCSHGQYRSVVSGTRP
jgi:membrane-associated phospholipid phosphatase